jgi:hypothetical protein
MEAISEELPATPRLQHVLHVPVPHERWPMILPCTTTHKPRNSRVVYKPAPPGEKKGSPLRKSWVLPDSGDLSEESVADLEKRHGDGFSNFRVDITRLFSTGGRNCSVWTFPEIQGL